MNFYKQYNTHINVLHTNFDKQYNIYNEEYIVHTHTRQFSKDRIHTIRLIVNVREQRGSRFLGNLKP